MFSLTEQLKPAECWGCVAELTRCALSPERGDIQGRVRERKKRECTNQEGIREW